MIITDIRPLIAVAATLIAAVCILFFDKRENIRECFTVGAAFVTAGSVLSMVPGVLAGNQYTFTIFQATDKIALAIKTDPTGMVFACVSSCLYVLISFYSVGYMRGHHEKNQTGFYSMFAICICSAIGIALAANLITFFVFFEMLTIATWPLVFHARGDEDVFSGRKYLIYTLIPGQLMLVGIVIVYQLAGTLEFIPGGILSNDMASKAVLTGTFIILVAAGAVKAGMMPLHGWLPSAMVAPTPVSALLHAVAVVKAGAFAVVRVIAFVFGPSLLSEMNIIWFLSWLACFTIITSSVIALKQDNLKRRLAFSTVGQLSYIVLGASILTQQAMQGALFHIVAHAGMKITLFMCAGAIIVTTHKNNISEMHGIGRQMPITIACYTIGSLGIAGMPFIVGFLSKWNMALGALDAGRPLLIAVLVASALLSVTYLMPLTHLAYFKKNERGDFQQFREANLWMLIPMVIIAAICIILGTVPNAGPHLYEITQIAAQAIFH